MRVSRRQLLALGGSAVALASGAAFWKTRSSTRPHPAAASPYPTNVVDHRGWMLTAADKKKIVEGAPAPPASTNASDNAAAP